MRVIFLTDRNDSHVRRFSQAFAENFLDYVFVPLEIGETYEYSCVFEGETFTGWSEITRKISQVPSVVVSGPLDTVSSHLQNVGNPHIGISWATDVMTNSPSAASQLDWLEPTVQSLDILVTDNLATENAFIAVGAKPRDILRFSWGPNLDVKPSTHKSRWGLPEEEKIGLFGRSLSSIYDPLTFIDALSQIRREFSGWKWCLLERGDLLFEVRALAERLGVANRLIWMPEKSSREFDELVSAFDCLVSAPLTDGTSVTVLQAMRAKVPVLVSRTSGAMEWVTNGVTGWTFAPGSSPSMVAALEAFLESSVETKSRIAENAYRLVSQRDTWPEGVERLVSSIEKLRSLGEDWP